MKFVDEFRDPELASRLIEEIRVLVANLSKNRKTPIQLMEFCGGHTHTIFRYGIEQLLPKEIELVHGPGCPVCVLPMGRVDDCISLTERKNVILTTFGDAMRVPGSRGSLLQARAAGANVQMVYSPLDALELAKKNPNHEVIFFALGFETTMPSTALTVLTAVEEQIENFSLFCNHITSVPTIKAVLDSPYMCLDGFIAPGHVSMVVGEQPFQFVAENYKKPIVITGFEPLDVLQSIWMLIKQFAENRCELENQYSRIVKARGNDQGMEAIAEVFELREFFEWRGLGSIAHSGIKLKDKYAAFDAEKKFSLPNLRVADPKSCQCGEVLTGTIKPWQCKVFGTECTPESPLGALMVSSEGACAAYYSFGNISELLAKKESEMQESKA